MKSSPGFSTVELVGAILLFSAATSGVLYMGKAMRDHRMAAISTNEQNAYATFQSQVTLQGIDPTLVANPMADAINQGRSITGGAATAGQNLNAAFESNAVAQPVGAQRSLAGSVRGSQHGATCLVERLMVHPDHQRQGIGAALLHALEDRFPTAHRFELFTGHKSEDNIRLYQKLGYAEFHREGILVSMAKTR